MERDETTDEWVNTPEDFNSHAHVERDKRIRKFALMCRISTHTLTWSVTVAACEYRYEEDDFNSHAHVERDDQDELRKAQERHFNSHAHVERDQDSAATIRLIGISTHTLTWSVTCRVVLNHSIVLFQLTRSRGA